MQENRAAKKTITFLIVTIIISGISFYIGGLYAKNNLQVFYVSQKEILNLESERMQQEAIEDQQLFFGKPEMAISCIEQEQGRMSTNGVLVLLADSKIYGNNVSSVSKQIHNKIVQELGRGKAK